MGLSRSTNHHFDSSLEFVSFQSLLSGDDFQEKVDTEGIVDTIVRLFRLHDSSLIGTERGTY